MRYCEKCGKEIPKDAIYCPYCKTSIRCDKTSVLKIIVIAIVGAVILLGICKGCNLSQPIFTNSITEVNDNEPS